MINQTSSLNQILEQERQTILEVATTYGAKTVKIFGSVGRGQSGPGSDLDLLVEFKPGYSLLDLIAMKQDLEDLLGCTVDVVTEAALSPYFRQQVLEEAVSL